MKCILTAGVFAATAATTFAADWPQWRGPVCNGTAPDSNPPVKWSESENVKWKFAIPGKGQSTPIISGNLVFITTAIPVPKKPDEAKPADAKPAATDAKPETASAAPNPASGAAPPPPPPGGPQGGPPGGPREGRRGRGGPGGGGGGGRGFGGGGPVEPQKFVLICLDLNTGKPKWEKTLVEVLPHEGHHGTGSFASGSAVTDGKHVYAFLGSRGLFCCDFNGDIKWKKDIGKMQIRNSFGEGASPALYKNYLIVNWDHQGEDFIVAYDKSTGDQIWKTPRDEDTSWSTPLVVMHNGKEQVVVAATKRVRSYDLATGKEIWECAGMTSNCIPTPVTANDVVYAISGFRGAALRAIKLGKSGDLTDSDSILWKHDDRTPYVPSPLLSGDRLYFYSGNEAVLSCLDAKSGTPHYAAARVEGMRGVYASPVAGGGRVYLASQDGVTVVLKDDNKMEVLATNKLDDRFDASPAIVGKNILLRGQKNLYCLE